MSSAGSTVAAFVGIRPESVDAGLAMSPVFPAMLEKSGMRAGDVEKELVYGSHHGLKIQCLQAEAEVGTPVAWGIL